MTVDWPNKTYSFDSFCSILLKKIKKAPLPTYIDRKVSSYCIRHSLMHIFPLALDSFCSIHGARVVLRERLFMSSRIHISMHVEHEKEISYISPAGCGRPMIPFRILSFPFKNIQQTITHYTARIRQSRRLLFV